MKKVILGILLFPSLALAANGVWKTDDGQPCGSIGSTRASCNITFDTAGTLPTLKADSCKVLLALTGSGQVTINGESSTPIPVRLMNESATWVDVVLNSSARVAEGINWQRMIPVVNSGSGTLRADCGR